MSRSVHKYHRGFTLIELLIVVGIIGTLASVTIVAINPNKQLNAAREAARLNDVKNIQNAMNQYLIDVGSFPNVAQIPLGSAKPICKQGVTNASCVDLSPLVPKYLASIPQDTTETNTNFSGYQVDLNNGKQEVYSSYYHLITSGLMGYWRFDEQSGTAVADASGNGNNGTISGPTTWVSGVRKNALSFGNTYAYVDIPHNATLSQSQALTITAWIKINGIEPGYADVFINKWTSTTDANFAWYIFGTTSGIPGITGMLANANGSWAGVSGSYTLVPGVWAHVAFTYKSTVGGLMYINGQPIGGPQGSGPLATNTTDIIISMVNSGAGGGLIDDVRLYNRALTTQEIQDIYAGNG